MKLKNPFQRSQKKADSAKNNAATEEVERCVMCGEWTAVPVSMPIELREDYIVGCGQLCHSCCLALQSTEDEQSLSTAQILKAVEQSTHDRKM